MATATEEQQAREFLKRAEIRTMKKDLRALRESDALKERDKIAKIRTLDEQLDEQRAKQAAKMAKETAQQNAGVKEVLSRNETEERLAEKDLKNYALEEERQQIFLLESQRLGFEKQIDTIDKEKVPTLKLEKNKLFSQKGNFQTKLNSILEEERKMEGEQQLITKTAQKSTVASQKKSLEQRRWDIDKDIQEVEKKRWAAEKQIQEVDEKVKQIDERAEQLVAEKNSLRDKVLGIDKSLRNIYSTVIARVEETRRGEAREQLSQKQKLSASRAEEKERVQREQWGGISVPKKKEFLQKAPPRFKDELAKTAEAEEEQRKKFLQNVEDWANDKNQIPVPTKK